VPGDGATVRRPSASARLVALSYLKAQWNEGRSFLDNFVPYVAECLRRRNVAVRLEDVREDLAEHFGLEIPLHTVGELLGRAANKGLVVDNEGLFIPQAGSLAGWAMPDAQAEMSRCQTALTERFAAFAQRRFSKELTVEEASAAIDAYVEDHAVPLMLRVRGGPDSTLPLSLSETTVMVAAFIEQVFESDPECFGYLERVVQGSMLASALYLPDPGSITRKFRKTVVYLDTPFVLQLLGHAGSRLETPA